MHHKSKINEEKLAPGETEEALTEANERRRDFIKKFGAYAATAPLAMYVLMSPTRSAAAASDTGPRF